MHDEEAATAAIKALRGYFFYGRPLRANYAKTNSDFTAKLNNTFNEEVKKVRIDRQTEELRQREIKVKRKMLDKLIRLRKQCSTMPGQGDDDKFKSSHLSSGGFLGQPAAFKILFIEQLPKKVKAETLEQIFGNYNGFNEVRVIDNKGMAFVEFDSDDYASYALNTLKQ
jgi:U2 small nuclear ribonucleoprotein B''